VPAFAATGSLQQLAEIELTCQYLLTCQFIPDSLKNVNEKVLEFEKIY
jgi:hypothetical protein